MKCSFLKEWRVLGGSLDSLVALVGGESSLGAALQETAS